MNHNNISSSIIEVLRHCKTEVKMARSIFTNFQALLNWLYVSTPTFPVKGDQVRTKLLHHSSLFVRFSLRYFDFQFQVSILTKPEEFYDSLVNRCSQATTRIVLASLYLGTGGKEQRLVRYIHIFLLLCSR